jgi:hypothetical protein
MPSNVLHLTLRCAGGLPFVVENFIAEAKPDVFSTDRGSQFTGVASLRCSSTAHRHQCVIADPLWRSVECEGVICASL